MVCLEKYKRQLPTSSSSCLMLYLKLLTAREYTIKALLRRDAILSKNYFFPFQREIVGLAFVCTVPSSQQDDDVLITSFNTM